MGGIAHEELDFISICPKCIAFSILMNINWERMSEEKKLRLRTECLAMLHFSIQVASHQLQHGRSFQLEQPGGASSWSLFAMERLLQQPGVTRFVFDQCMTGLSATGVATNHIGVALLLSSYQCDGGHQHAHLESGLLFKAQQYPKIMVRTIVDGLERGLEAPSSFPAEVNAEAADEEEGEDLEEALDRSIETSDGERVASRVLAQAQMQKAMKVHVNMGHLNKAQMMALFKAADAKSEVLNFAKENFRCDQCMKQKKAY